MGQTFTASTRIVPINVDRNIYWLNIYLAGTGDASGGSVDYNAYPLGSVLKNTDRLTLKDFMIYTNNAVTDVFSFWLFQEQWDALRVAPMETDTPYVIGAGALSLNGTGTVFTCERHQKLIPDSGIYLGSPTEDPIIHFHVTPNVDTKTYRGNIGFILQR